MLQKLGDHIAACRDRANTYIAASTTETDARIAPKLDLAQQWEHVAKTYEFVASLERSLLDQQNAALSKEVERAHERTGELTCYKAAYDKKVTAEKRLEYRGGAKRHRLLAKLAKRAESKPPTGK
jgi:hypothetical protein